MKKIIACSILFLLISCGGGNDNNTQSICTSNTTNLKSVADANSIQVILTRKSDQSVVKNVPVQIDNNGLCILSDDKGQVAFTNLTSGQHDIHVFPSGGTFWKSSYGINASKGKNLHIRLYDFSNRKADRPVANSYINLKGAVKNHDLANNIRIAHISDKLPSKITESNLSRVTSYNYQLDFSEIGATSVVNKLFAFETYKNLNTEILIDTVETLKFSANTQNSIALAQSTPLIQDIVFNATKITPTKLAQISVINPPVGLSISRFSIYSFYRTSIGSNSFFDSVDLYKIDGVNINVPSSVSSYIPAFVDKTNLSLNIYARKDKFSGASWSYFKDIAAGETLNSITPKISSIPEFLPNPQGRKIEWSSAGVPLEYQFLFIDKFIDNNLSAWEIDVNGSATEVTLPTIPAGVTTFINTGIKYTLSIYGGYGYIDQQNSKNNFYEDFSNYSTYTK